MAETSRSRVTITLGRTGQVVKRAGALLDRDEPVPAVGSKRSVKERLGGGFDAMQLDHKRLRGDNGRWNLKDSNCFDDLNLTKDDLRFKIMKQTQSNSKQNIVDLRDMLSRSARPSVTKPITPYRLHETSNGRQRSPELRGDRPRGPVSGDNRSRGPVSRDDRPHVPVSRDDRPHRLESRDDRPRGLVSRDDRPRGPESRDDRPPGPIFRDDRSCGPASRDERPRGPVFRDDVPRGPVSRNDGLRGSIYRDDESRGPVSRNDSPRVLISRDERPCGPASRDERPRGPVSRNHSPRGPVFRDDVPRGPVSRNDGLRGSVYRDDEPRGPVSRNDSPRGLIISREERPRGPVSRDDRQRMVETRDGRQFVPEPHDVRPRMSERPISSMTAHQYTPSRTSEGRPRMDVVGSSHSPWTLDHIRHKSPDRVINRGLSPQRRQTYEDSRSGTNSRLVPPTSSLTKHHLSAGPVKSVGATPLSAPTPPPGGNMQRSQYPVSYLTVEGFLSSLGLEKYLILFKVEEVDMHALSQMGDQDLKELGIPMGPRKKVLLALLARTRRQAR